MCLILLAAFYCVVETSFSDENILVSDVNNLECSGINRLIFNVNILISDISFVSVNISWVKSWRAHSIMRRKLYQLVEIFCHLMYL